MNHFERGKYLYNTGATVEEKMKGLNEKMQGMKKL